MTVPNERRNAILRAEDFLYSLLDAKRTPRVPKAIRQQARSLLKHYPSKFYMEIARKKCPEVFGEWND